MISKENFYKAIEVLGFKRNGNSMIWSKYFGSLDCVMEADMSENKPTYPEQIQSDSNTTRNFSQPESYVVFICIAMLLDKGYRPEHIYLEKTWALGHSAKSGRADITVYDENGNNVLFIIECKRAGKDFSDARKMLFEGRDDKQLFSYLAQARSAKWLQLLAIDYDEEKKDIKIFEEIVKSHDDENVAILAEKDESILLYKKASQAEDLFRVWDETYNKKTYKGLIFGKDTTAYKIGLRPLCKKDLAEFSNDDGITNSFLEILRHNSISDKENAFNKLLSLFICKMVDEKERLDDDEVDFQYKEGTDNYFTLYERLLRLFHRGMDKFLKEDVFYLEDDYITRTLNQYTGKQRKYLEAELKQSFQRTKLLSCQVFAFREIYNEKLFMQNGKVLVEMVELFQNYRLAYSSRKAFLGELFENLLNQGFKQDEGQFFTPMPITRFIWNSLPIERFVNFETRSCPKVIDYACGAGHFLTEGISAISDAFKDHGFTGEQEMTDEEISASFYGVEKDNRLARVSKVALLLNGANEAHIKAMDGLDHDENFLGEKNTFDILVANPPYAVDAFKAHLERRILKEFDLLQFMSASSDDIENVFIERIDQLLKPHGIAGVVLPSSILNVKDTATTKAREILLKHFRILCITSFESKTFGATNTPTVVLFLEKREINPARCEIIKDSIEAIFKETELTGWEDKEIYNSYISTIDVQKEMYEKFRMGKMAFGEMEKCQYFNQYLSAFKKSKELKELKKKAVFKKYGTKLQEQASLELFNSIYTELEKEKLYYYALTYQEDTLLINAPKGTDEQKVFLGYEIIGRKGCEGLVEGEGLLTNKYNRNSNDKIASIVKQHFNGLSHHIDKAEPYVSVVNLASLLNFTRDRFDKTIKPLVVADVKSKYELFRLDNENIFALSIGERVLNSELVEGADVPVFSANVKNPFGTIDKMLIDNFDCPSVLWGIDGDWLVNYIPAHHKFYPTDHCGVLRVKTDDFNPYYVSLVLDLVGKRHNFSRAYRASIDRIKGIKIPCPPKNIQDEIAEQCMIIDKEYETSRMTIEEYRSKIESLFVKLNIIEVGGVKIKDISEYITERTSNIDLASYITTDNMLQNFEGVKAFTGKTEAESAVAYRKGDILLSNIRPYLKKLWLADKDGCCSPDVLVFRPDTTKVLPEFLYYSLRRDDFIDFIMHNAGTKGIKMPRGNKEEIPNYSIALPSFVNQSKLITEIMEYEKKISEARKIMLSCPLRKQAVLDECLN